MWTCLYMLYFLLFFFYNCFQNLHTMDYPEWDITSSAILDNVSFQMFTKEEILKLSVKEITVPDSFDLLLCPIPGGVYDPALGKYKHMDKFSFKLCHLSLSFSLCHSFCLSLFIFLSACQSISICLFFLSLSIHIYLPFFFSLSLS